MSHRPHEPGTITAQQIDRMKRSASAARVVGGNHLLALARAERNRRRAKERSVEPVWDLRDLSMHEATALITLLDERRNGPVPTTCARCARLGFAVDVDGFCMHDRGAETDRDAAMAEYERRRGVRSW